MANSLVTFEVEGMLCAIDAAAVVEMLRAVALRAIPGQPAFLAGVIDVRGTIVPVIDVRARFGHPARALLPKHRFIVVRLATSTLLTLWVDRIVEVVPLRRNALTASERFMIGTRSFAGVAKTAEGLVMIHDVEAFLTEAELDALALSSNP